LLPQGFGVVEAKKGEKDFRKEKFGEGLVEPWRASFSPTASRWSGGQKLLSVLRGRGQTFAGNGTAKGKEKGKGMQRRKASGSRPAGGSQRRRNVKAQGAVSARQPRGRQFLPEGSTRQVAVTAKQARGSYYATGF